MQILLIEDDKSLAMAVSYRLKKEGFDISAHHDGASAWSALQEAAFDIVLLDRMLPGMSGDELLRRMRAAGLRTPVLMLTAMDGIGDRVGGLDAGADDYLVKPFAMDELLARVRALCRRPPTWTPEDELGAGDLRLDRQRLLLRCGENSAALSRREAGLMEFLLRNAGLLLPRAVLLDRVWSDTVVEDGNLDIYVHFLRRKLAGLHSRARIATARGVGYRLEL